MRAMLTKLDDSTSRPLRCKDVTMLDREQRAELATTTCHTHASMCARVVGWDGLTERGIAQPGPCCAWEAAAGPTVQSMQLQCPRSSPQAVTSGEPTSPC